MKLVYPELKKKITTTTNKQRSCGVISTMRHNGDALCCLSNVSSARCFASLEAIAYIFSGGTKLFRTSNFIKPCYHEALLFSGLVISVVCLLFSQPIV